MYPINHKKEDWWSWSIIERWFYEVITGEFILIAEFNVYPTKPFEWLEEIKFGRIYSYFLYWFIWKTIYIIICLYFYLIIKLVID